MLCKTGFGFALSQTFAAAFAREQDCHGLVVGMVTTPASSESHIVDVRAGTYC